MTPEILTPLRTSTAAFISKSDAKVAIPTTETPGNKIEEIGGYQFTWNNNVDDHRAGSIDYGVIAQEVEEILPHAVDINNRGYKTVNYNSLIPLLIEAVKELSGRVKELEKGDEIDGEASVIHDQYCKTKSRSQKDTHRIFRELLEADGVPKIKAWAMWAAVRIYNRVKNKQWK